MTQQAQVISVQAVRDYLQLNTTASSSQYSDATIGSNIRAAQSAIEKATGRWFVDRPATTFTMTTQLRAVVDVPGFRAVTTLTWGGATLTANDGYWLLPDQQNSGIYVAVQFRAFRADPSGMPWWLADSKWFDKALDSPFYPGNYGGGYFYTSMPNDLVIVGDGGYASGSEPEAFLDAVKIYAAFKTMRPASLLADVAITPQGGVLTYSQFPPEVRQFIADWSLSTQVTSVGG